MREVPRVIQEIAAQVSSGLSYAQRNRLVAFLRQASEAEMTAFRRGVEDLLAGEQRLVPSVRMPDFWETFKP